jgi:hypothetical protein
MEDVGMTSDSKVVSPEMQPETRAVRRYEYDCNSQVMCEFYRSKKDVEVFVLASDFDALARTVDELTAANAALREERDTVNRATHRIRGHGFADHEMLWNERCVNCGSFDSDLTNAPCDRNRQIAWLVTERDQAQAELREARAALELAVEYIREDAANSSSCPNWRSTLVARFDAAIKGKGV